MNELNFYILILSAFFIADLAVCFAIKHERNVSRCETKREKLLSKTINAMKQNPVRGVL